jgi:hypothetical protein
MREDLTRQKKKAAAAEKRLNKKLESAAKGK